MDHVTVVYNPDDEELEFKFDGKLYTLAPNDLTPIPRPALVTMMDQIGQFGVTVIPQGSTVEEINEIKEAAEKRHMQGTRKWAEDVLLSGAKRNKERTEAGLQPFDTADEISARRFLSHHGLLKVMLLAFLLLPLCAQAQTVIEQKKAPIAYNWDLTATSYTYCRYLGLNGDPWANSHIPGRSRIKTSGSSTTVTEYVTGDNPFTEISVGDILYIQQPYGAPEAPRLVTARASAASITVDTAIDLSATGGFSWTWRKQSCGSTISDGWFPVGNFYTLTFSTEWATKNATSLEAQVECRLGNVSASPTIINSASLSAVGNNTVIITDGVFDSCRLGLKLTTDTGAQSVYANVGMKR